MKITFLGTGTSQGVPVIACDCEICQSLDSKDKRLRSSVLIEIGTTVFVIDAGPDFRQQMLRAKVKRLDFILITHEHKDHMSGLDDVRSFNFIQKRAMDIYAEMRVQKAIRREFAYVFAEKKYPGVPKMDLIELKNEAFKPVDFEIIPIRGIHYKLPVFGFRVGNFAYITDMNGIEDAELKKLKGLEVFVINALRKETHISHFNLSEALEVIEKIKPKKAFLTHISHAMGKAEYINKELPDNVRFAYDGLEIEL